MQFVIHICNIKIYFYQLRFLSELELQFVLDAIKTKGRRLYFLEQEGITSQPRRITVKKGKKWTYSFKAYVHPPPQISNKYKQIHDKLTPIDVEVQYKLASPVGRGNVNN